MHCWASDHLSSLCSQASLIFLAFSSHDTFLKFHPCQDLIPAWPCLIRLSELKNVFDVICSPCSIFLFFSFFFFHHVSLMFYIRAVPLNTRNYKLPTKNGSNRHSNHPLWQCVCLIVCLIVWILLCFCLSSYIPLKCLKKKSGKAAQATEERWAVFKMDRNWTLSRIMFFTLHSSSSCYHCNNSPLAGTLCRLCVLWVMCCNPKWRSSRKK